MGEKAEREQSLAVKMYRNDHPVFVPGHVQHDHCALAFHGHKVGVRVGPAKFDHVLPASAKRYFAKSFQPFGSLRMSDGHCFQKWLGNDSYGYNMYPIPDGLQEKRFYAVALPCLSLMRKMRAYHAL